MKRNFIKSGVLLIAFAFLTSSCEKEYFVPPKVSDTDVQSFSKVVLPILTKNCLGNGCHTVNGGVVPYMDADLAYESLTNGSYVDTVNVEKSLIYQKIAIEKSKPMPPKGKLLPADIEKIRIWIKQGAQNN